MFVDESGFYLLASVRHTWSPIGQTPVLVEKAGRDHLSAISGVTLHGAIYSAVQHFMSAIVWFSVTSDEGERVNSSGIQHPLPQKIEVCTSVHLPLA